MATEQYTPNLGHLCGGTARRDAVHVAVAPVVAGEDLRPGWRVGLLADGTAGRTAPVVGIIDPFLEIDYIRKGERFWLCLFPGTITGLRHLWSHPAFVALVPEVLP